MSIPESPFPSIPQENPDLDSASFDTTAAVTSGEMPREGDLPRAALADETTPDVVETRVSGRDGREVDIRVKVKSNQGGIVAGIVENVQRMLNYHDLTPQYVRACVGAFAPPAGLEVAKETLRARHVVVVVAGADSGRHDAAVVLLHSRPGVTLREVRREPGDRLDIEALGLERSSGWLLDLRGEPGLEHSFGRALMAQREQLRSRNSYLAVVVSPDLLGTANAGAGELEFWLTSVDAAAIVTFRLTAREYPVDARPYLDDGRIRRRLEHAGPAEAVLWANTIADVDAIPIEDLVDDDLDRIDADQLQHKRIDHVLKVRGNWRPELLTWHIEHPDSRTRHFLLASAVLEGCPAGHIFTAATSLAAKFKEPEPDVVGLRGAGILELVSHIDATLDDERVRFGKPDYANAILDYFWVDRQHLQTVFMDWMCAQPHNLAPDDAERVTNRIATYVLRWTVRHRSVRLLRQVLRQWAPHPSLHTVVHYLLTAAALDPDFGKTVRDSILDWAKDDEESVPVLAAIAALCAGDMARFYPKIALYRLVTLSRHRDPLLAAAVTKAIATLWRDTSLHLAILQHVQSWCASIDPARQTAGTNAFLAIAGMRDSDSGLPELAISNQIPPDTLTNALIAGWRAVCIVQPTKSLAAAALTVWIDAARTSTDHATSVPDILAQAVGGIDERDTDARRLLYLTRIMLYPLGQGDDASTEDSRIREAILSYVYNARPELGLRNATIPHTPTSESHA